ncbi:orcinol O-methyltransferase [Medicago truncatula]|uniref:isoflavone 7-O-methyltransferase n=1 Tax=Medicago truncatula TaxID=3880 RepID=G7KFI9_MEDTR|nr:orcinol O-methyltransferase [Medicago truncatula]
MESQHGDNVASNLLKAQSHIWKHIFNFINSMSLKCVVDLGIPDIIHNYGRPMSLSKLISSLPINPTKTCYFHRLIRIMTYSGIFSQQNITENDPMSVVPNVNGILSPVMMEPWHQFSAWLKNDDITAFETTHGMSFRDYLARDSKINNSFNESMAKETRLVSDLLVEKCKGVFNEVESLVDVGGGTGTMAKTLAKSFPQMECIVFDLPHVVDGLLGSENLNYVGGDMFKEIPPTAAILLKWILHDWNDEECVKILKNCKDAISKKGKEGKVVIFDKVFDSEKGNINESVETQLFFDMFMMVVFAGKERNEKEWIKLISSAGFSDYKITPILGSTSMIEIYP